MDNSLDNERASGSIAARLRQRLSGALESHGAAILSLVIRASGVLAGFAVTYMIGRSMGASATGQFALVNQTAMFLGAVGLIGMDVGAVRHFAKTLATGAPLALATVAKVFALGLGFMVVIGLAMWLAGDVIWTPLFGDIVPRELLLILCLLLVARGGTHLAGAVLRSQHRFTIGQLVAALSISGTTAIALASGFASSVEGALWAAVIGGVLGLCVAAFAIGRHLSRGEGALNVPLRTVTASSLPLWGVGIALTLGDWYGLAIAAGMLGAAEAGLYRVAVQIASVLQIISVALLSVYSAKISTANHSGDMEQVALLARSSIRLSTTIALPATVVLLAGSGFLLAQIGEEFVAAQTLVYILVVGQLAYTLTAPSGLVLAMLGHERINFAIALGGAGVLLASVPFAANYAGLHGIAACISGIMLLRNFTAYAIVRYKLGINIWAGTVHAKAAASE